MSNGAFETMTVNVFMAASKLLWYEISNLNTSSFKNLLSYNTIYVRTPERLRTPQRRCIRRNSWTQRVGAALETTNHVNAVIFQCQRERNPRIYLAASHTCGLQGGYRLASRLVGYKRPSCCVVKGRCPLCGCQHVSVHPSESAFRWNGPTHKHVRTVEK